MIDRIESGKIGDIEEDGEDEMSVLIAVASRHGGTRGIAEAIADGLRRAKIMVAVRDASWISGRKMVKLLTADWTLPNSA